MINEKKTTNSPLTKVQIKKFMKLQDKAEDNMEKTGYYVDEYDYCYGSLAEDLCDAGDKEWARRIYKIVEEQIDNGKITASISLLPFADHLVNYLDDKEWAKKIYKKAEEELYINEIELADDISRNLGDKKWAKLVEQKAKKEK